MKPIHVNFYSLQQYDEQASFKNVCPSCPDGILLMARNIETGELLEGDCCVVCGQIFVYDDIEQVRKQHGWGRG